VKLKFITLLFILGIARSVVAQDLLETYHLALENDPQLKQAYFTQFSVAESKSQSIAQMLPTLSASARSSRERLNNKKANFQTAGSQHFWNNGFTIDFSQPIFHWDHWVQLSQSDNRIAQAEAEYKAELQNLIVRITEAYFNILSAQDNLAFTIAEQTAIERQLEQAKQRFDVGLIAITDVYEAQAGYDQAVANQIDAANLLDDSKEALREIIGDNEVDIQALGTDINFSAPEPNNIKEWNTIAEANNLTIIAAFNQLEINRKNIAIQQSGHLPTLDLVASYNVQDVTSSFGQRGDSQSIGLQFNLPLFQGGMVYSQSKQAQYDFQAAKENLLGTRRLVKRQLRNAFRDVISSLSRIHALKATVASSNSSLEASEAGFEVGTRTMVDVLAEQRNLFRAKRDHSRSRYDYLVNGVKLKQAASSLTEDDLQKINQYLVQKNKITEATNPAS
jgi:outer membrane protein